MSDWNPRANEIFIRALDCTNPSDRQRLIDEGCGNDQVLRHEVEQMLSAANVAGRFLDAPNASQPASTGENLSAVSPKADLLHPGSVFAKRFQIREKLGEGGMGAVYLAEQNEPVRRLVAIKIIKPSLDLRTVMRRFEQERQALALMEHPHIAQVFEAGVADAYSSLAEELPTSSPATSAERGIPYFVMEYIKGTPITEYCDASRLQLNQRLDLFIPVCQAVQHAHQKGIIHRDLKPSNILVQTIDDRPVAKVIDFGVAKVTGPQLTEESVHTDVGSLVGTLEYMSPEQARFSEDLDTRTDVYALGVVLYELLTGAVPHSRRELQQAGLEEMLRTIREVDPATPSTKLSHSGALANVAAVRAAPPHHLISLVRGDLDWIVMKALEKDRSRRYESVGGLASDIRRFLNEEIVLARPPSAWYILIKTYHRRRKTFLAVAAILLLMVLGIIGTSAGYIASSRNARLAFKAEQETRAALAEVTKQRDLAETRRQVAESIQRFLQVDLLRQADVEFQSNQLLELKRAGASTFEVERDPTIRELLDRAAGKLATDKIETAFPNQPVVQAELLRTVGRTYASIGEFTKAIKLLERARRLYERHAGPDHLDTVQTKFHLGLAYFKADQMDVAISLCEEVVAQRTELLGRDHQQTLDSISGLGVVLQRNGQFHAAQTLLEELYERALNSLGDDHPLTLRATHNLAIVYGSLGKRERSLQLLEQVARRRMELFGDEHPATLVARVNLSITLLENGDPKSARSILEATLDSLHATLGPNHPKTLSTQNYLAETLRMLGEDEAAAEMFEELTERRTAVLGKEHVDTLGSMNGHAALLWSMGKLDQSIPLFEFVHEEFERKYGPNAGRTQFIAANLAVNYRDAGRLDEAIALFEGVVTRGNAQTRFPWVIKNLAQTYELNGQWDEAESLLQDMLTTARGEGENKAMLWNALFGLGRHYMNRKDYVAAEPLLRESLENHKPSRTQWTHLWAQSMLGEALVGQQKYAESEQHLLDAYQGMRDNKHLIPASYHEQVAIAGKRIVELYQAWEKSEEAERWQTTLQPMDVGPDDR